jgi:hypothetical protein
MRLLPLQRTGVFILLTFASFALPVRATGPHLWGCDLTACKSHPLSNQVFIEQLCINDANENFGDDPYLVINNQRLWSRSGSFEGGCYDVRRVFDYPVTIEVWESDGNHWWDGDDFIGTLSLRSPSDVVECHRYVSQCVYFTWHEFHGSDATYSMSYRQDGSSGLDLTEQYQRIPVYRASALCLDVQGSPTARAPVRLWDCGDYRSRGTSQNWVYDRQRGTIVNGASGKCLDVQWASTTPGTPVWLWDCNGTDAQRWTYDPKTHVLQNALGTVLDIQWGNLEKGTPVWTWPRNEGWAQQWRAE